MMRVLALRASKRTPERIYIELEGADSIKSTAAVVAQFALYAGRELDDEEYAAVREASLRAGTLSTAMRVVSRRPVSKGELVEKLCRGGEDEAAALEAADRLEELGAVDDMQYALSVVRHYSAKGYGPGRIKSELSRRRVPRELWEEALGSLPEDDGRVYAQLERFMRGSAPDRQTLKRAGDSLYRRGFSWESISAAISRYEREYSEE